MDNSELYTKVINLGKIFVKELGLEPGVDTFSRWMAHYIAEKMTLAESLSAGKEKDEAEKDCFETILKLWKHRNSIPNGRRPLENFESIFKILENLDPDNSTPFFHRLSRVKLAETEISGSFHDEVKGFLDYVLQIDRVAKVWVEYILQKAAAKANDEKSIDWLRNAIDLPENDDVLAISFILKYPGSSDTENSQEESLRKQSLIKRRIKELEKFAELNTFLLNHYKADLSRL